MGTNNGMEGHIVFTNELVQFHILGILPPLLPIVPIKIVSVSVSFGNTHIANTGVEPHVEDFVLVLFVA